ncbi:MAG: aspartate aminotransferase family protein [Clostridiaceae bacterium]|nr:aspartate aminotransferase family protein [Clostridiaceae bacterium]
MNTFELVNEYVAQTYGRAPVAFVSGKGSELFDESGKRYIDLGSGIAVNAFGVSDDAWLAAVVRQASTLQHTSNLYYTAPMARLAQLLCEKSGMKKVFFGNSGAEANEGAIKAARKYAHDKYGDERSTIVTLQNSFHGRTIATLAATGQDAFHTHFGPFPEGFDYVPANDLTAMEQKLSEKPCAAVMMELVQGEGGVMALDPDYVRGVEKLCRAHDALLVVDEVQTGNGRTGKYFAYQVYGITPDIVTTAKGIAGGLPMGAVLFGERTENVLEKGQHGSTFGGNPVCAAAAISIVSRIDDTLLDEVREKGDYIRHALEGTPHVGTVTGLGLMIGIETDKKAADVVDAARESGVVVLTAHDRVRLVPALNIPMALLREAIGILKEVLSA